jgi:DMSO/TMAO reductase YedYZ molybdopterin-dependent catalytic subunit
VIEMDESANTDRQSLWELARNAGISRRNFVRLMAIGGAAAVVAAVETGSTALAQSPSPGAAATAAPPEIFGKSEEPFLKVFDTELGTPWFDETTFVTPHEHFYVRNRYASPIVDPATWTLRVTGDAIEEALTLTYDELIALPTRYAPRVMECFGNGRTVNREQLGYEVQGGNWGFSDVSQGEWAYVPISEILDRVRPTSDAVQLLFWSGVDGPDTGRPMPIQDVLDRADVIGLAYKLNGVPLQRDHGGPVRALVPGWGGAASVKWLTEIRIASHRFWTRMHTKEEAYIGSDYPPEEVGPDDEFLNVTEEDVRGQTGTWLTTKSWLALPYVIAISDPPGNYPLAKGEVPTLAAGAHTMRGYANSPVGIEKVEYQVDDGEWQEARLVPPFDLELSWVRFEFDWDAEAGNHVLRTRATDKDGEVQPETVPLNELGINCNAIPAFQVDIA